VRIRVRYSKTGKVRYVSAIDLGRIWERALRRADLPIAYSEGFSPHPKVSFPDALPLGYGSYAEYAELTFAGPIAIEPAIRSLNAAFPAGIAVRAAVEVQEGDPRLAKWLRASLWELVYPAEAAPALAAAVPVLRDADTIPVARERKGEFTETDLRPALHKIHQSSQTFDDAEGSRACVRVVFNHTEPPMRPSEMHQALRSAAGAHADAPLPELAHATRLAQGEPTSDGLAEALSGDLYTPLQPHTIEEGEHDRPEHT
jgi:radical SAM-linked protein